MAAEKFRLTPSSKRTQTNRGIGTHIGILIIAASMNACSSSGSNKVSVADSPTTLPLVTSIARHPSGFFESCLSALRSLIHPSAPPLILDASEKKIVEDLLDRTYAEVGGAYLLEEHGYAYLLDVPPSIRKKIFSAERFELKPGHISSRLHSIYDRQPDHGLLRSFDLVFQRSDGLGRSQTPYEIIEKRLALLEKDSAQVQALKASARERGQKFFFEQSLSNEMNPFFAIEVSQDLRQLRAPDGVEYPIEKIERDGTLLVRIPRHAMYFSQDFLDQAIVQNYMNDSKLGLNGFWGTFTADGRFIIVDQHHRVNAYANLHNDTVLVRVPKNSRGTYSAMPHFKVLQFYTLDRYLSPENISELQALSPTKRLIRLREFYYQITQRPRLK